MNSAGSFRWRQTSSGDADAIHSLTSLAGAIDHPYFMVPAEEVVADLATISRGDGLGIVRADDAGRIIAYGMVLPFAMDTSPVTALMLGAVAPDARRQGLGRRIIAWQRDEGFTWLRSRGDAAPHRLLTYVDAGAADARSLLYKAGFVASREYLHLKRRTDTPLRSVAPLGYAIESFSERHSEQVRRLRNAAFQDQWGAHAFDADGWSPYVERPILDKKLSRVMLDESGQVVAYTLVERSPDGERGRMSSAAYLASLGVESTHRHRGLGTALLGDLIAEGKRRGIDTVTLDVDSASESRANELYFRLGFEAAHRRLSYVAEHHPSHDESDS
jgi:mycothiol synthase